MEFFLEKSDYALVKPGSYHVMLHHYRTALMFKAPKLELVFAVVSHGEAYGARLSRFYNVDRFIGKAGKNGKFAVGRNRDFPRELLGLFHHRSPRRDRYPMSLFNGVTIEAKVVTVKSARNRKIPEALQYSKIEELVRVIEKA